MVYILLAKDFEEIEAVYPIDVLHRCGIEITTAGVGGEYIKGAHDIVIKTDVQIGDVKAGDVSMLILPGGGGRVNIIKCEQSMALIKQCCDNNTPIAAICGAPEILDKIGFLKGKKYTCYPGLQDNIDGEFIDAPVVIHDNLITSQAAGTSQAFAFAIAEFLVSADKSNQVKGQMLCNFPKN
jgi:4-methyl-5(b-hydroxyethyl)-thiazole monophosphate biosynthesis